MKSLIKKFLKLFRQLLLQNQREKKISSVLGEIISKGNKKNLKILDFGSGKYPDIAKILSKELKKKSINVKFDCYDFYDNTSLRYLNRNKNNLKFYNIDQFYENNKKYDFSLVIDVLHHVGVDNIKENIKIIKNLRKKSKILIIKDHFEWNFLSRLLLIFMDFIGNYHNDVSIPDKYFTQKKLDYILKKNKIYVKKKILNKRYHSRMFMFLSNPNFHFIYII